MELNTFSDIFIPTEGIEKTRAFCDGKLVRMEELEALKQKIESLLDSCKELKMEVGEDRFLLAGEVQFRVHLERRKDTDQYNLRRVPDFRPSLLEENPEGIQFPPQLVKLVKNQSQGQGGLFLVAGPLGSGKTSTAAALLNYFLTVIGGVGWTCEDPPEYDLEGDYGQNGVCYQHPVEKGNFADSIRSMMRCFPSGAPATLLIGEIRDSETAQQILKALLNGTRVIFTFHAETPENAITRFLAMCDGSEYARVIVARALRLLVTQIKMPGPDDKTQIKFDYLEGDKTVAAVIQSGNFSSLRDCLTQQRNSRKHGSKLLMSR